MLPISVILPVKNAEHMVDECLESIFRANPREVIMVDGNSTDRTVEIAKNYPVTLLTNEGKGVPTARRMGIEKASSEIVLLVDVDILLEDGTLKKLYDEFIGRQYDALQAGLISISREGYWGRALTVHHNRGLSKHWPGVMATLFKRKVLLDYRFDERFITGEDIELRWRLMKSGLKMSVSKETFVQHRFDDDFTFAKNQFVADGEGLGRMVSKYGWSAAKLIFIPAGGFVRGIFLSLLNFEPRWIPYYFTYLVYNYLAMPTGLKERLS